MLDSFLNTPLDNLPPLNNGPVQFALWQGMKVCKGWVTYRFLYAMCHNDARGWGLSLMTFWNSEKLSNVKVHQLSCTVNELFTCLIIDEKWSSNIYKISKNTAKLINIVYKSAQFVSCYSPYIQVNSLILLWFLTPKTKQKTTTTKKWHNQEDNGN